VNILQPYINIRSFDEEAVCEYLNKIDEIALNFGPEQPILIEINSLGGSAYNMIQLYEHIRLLQNPIITYTSSMAMSAGAILLSTLGSPGNRFASPNASIMIHEIQDSTGGDKKDILDYVADMTVFNDRLMTILAKSMGLNDNTDVVKLIKDNAKGNALYLTPEKALEFGIIDHVGYVKMQPKTIFEVITFLTEEEMYPPLTNEQCIEIEEECRKKGKKLPKVPSKKRKK